jgi:murein DD-endopeptidase MepM/ murein hydrolase activator NlpD
MLNVSFRRPWRSCLLAVFSVFLASSVAAYPLAAPVPGGIARVRLPGVAGKTPPLAFLGAQPVWVVAEEGHWLAIVGLALDTPEGTHSLRVTDGDNEVSVPFKVNAKNYPAQRIRLKDGSKVTLSDADETRALREIEQIQRLKAHWRAATDTDSDFLRPADGRLASRFGLRRFFNGEPRAPHSGLDFAVARGTPLNAVAGGRILAIGEYFFNGKTVFIDHGNGLITLYCHLDRIDVRAGDPIAKGQHIALSGMTGRASGPHVHWAVVLNGVMVDPELFLKQPAEKHRRS